MARSVLTTYNLEWLFEFESVAFQNIGLVQRPFLFFSSLGEKDVVNVLMCHNVSALPFKPLRFRINLWKYKN